ncbi:acyltransferase [Endozoicomonas sp. G2_1]|uniref:acyltransferase family protein n=1 Tax=Endozoicomonas sp. G2_1 TaxID=2821091 RepID=UPI001AD9F152|nr:acyltransferase family protein [Endozoicomonas sp. G2_1]MBO9490483.1 acyltransferase [Endozoicomonas sp. G2_1]
MRTDVQFLRGIAVISVVIYHSGLELIPFGFLGVDIFFVISGFLITKIILKQLDQNSFSFSGFYLKRAQRLLPALYSTLLVTFVLCSLLLTEQYWQEFIKQFIGAISFTSNFVLPSQSGYFESASELKPLLHIWSLSLEEQFYFFLPLLLFCIPQKSRIFFLTLLLIVSFIFCITWIYSLNQEAPFLWRIADVKKSEWAFFLLPTRMWELLAGSFVAWVMLYKPSVKIPVTIKYVSLISIFILFFIQINFEHPSLEALIIVTLTAILLLGDDNWLPHNKIIFYVAKIGDWSYSLYLIHWPLFSLANVVYIKQVPTIISVLLIITSLILAYFQYKYIENKFRFERGRVIFQTWPRVLLPLIVLFSLPFLLIQDNEDKESRSNYGLATNCEVNQYMQIKEECHKGVYPTAAIWGDSFAMHLIEGLIESNDNLVQITKPACGPFINIAQISKKYNKTWAKSCISYNEKALDYIISSDSIKYVIISSPLDYYLSKSNSILVNGHTEKANADILIDSFLVTVNKLKHQGKEVIFVTPPPSTGLDIYQCNQRESSNLLLNAKCEITSEKAIEFQKDVHSVIKVMKQHVKVFELSDIMCQNNKCLTEVDGVTLYRDAGHLSKFGSRFVLGNIVIKDI